MKIWINILFCFILSLKVAAQAPSVQASAITVVSKYCSQATLQWTNGNGVRRIVVARKDNPVSFLPASNTFYLSNSSFGLGTDIGSNQYVVFNGSVNTVSVENLEPNATYHFAIFEYNQAGLVINYLTSGSPVLSLTTEDISASFTMDRRNQCDSGNITNFFGTATSSNGAALAFRWDFDDGNFANTQNASHTYTDFGIYKVKLTASSFKCAASAILDDTIAPTPVVSFEMDASLPNNGQQQCLVNADRSLNEFTFKNNTISQSISGTAFSKTSYFRQYGDGTSDIFLKGIKTYEASGIYLVRLRAASTQDSVVFCADSFELSVEVRPEPIDTPLLDFEKEMCLDGNLFTLENNTPDLATVSSWNFGDGNSSTGSSVNHTYASEGQYYITLEVIDGNGCFDAYLDSVRVAPQPDNTYGGLNRRYCIGDEPVELEATLGNGVWIGRGVDVSGVFFPSVLGPDTIRYAVNVDGCNDTFTQYTEVFDVPSFELGNDTTICQGTSFTKRILKGSTTTAWSTGDIDSFAIVSTSGIVWAQRTENGCSYSDTINVQVIALPTVNLGRDSVLCGDGQLQLDVTAPEATYAWSDGYSGGGKRTITSTGNYRVTVANKCGTATGEVVLEFLPFVCDVFVPNAFSPNDDGLNDIFKPTGNVEILSMQVYDTWGTKIYENSSTEKGWDGTVLSKPAQGGQYYFIIRYLLPTDGTSVPRTTSGDFYLVR